MNRLAVAGHIVSRKKWLGGRVLGNTRPGEIEIRLLTADYSLPTLEDRLSHLDQRAVTLVTSR